MLTDRRWRNKRRRPEKTDGEGKFIAAETWYNTKVESPESLKLRNSTMRVGLNTKRGGTDKTWRATRVGARGDRGVEG